ncbi:MAG: histidinol dehydrogenase [Treponema sp.]|jgi:histidinol dehydrogenase/sulfopropanediol 3-dehydrogenase|nr:histidinol dehydrogenase [Treponema sp.]
MPLTTIKAGAAAPQSRDSETAAAVGRIIADVRTRGEAALLDYAARFDHAALSTVRVEARALRDAARRVDSATLEAIRFAAGRIRAFAERQRACLHDLSYADAEVPGLVVGHRFVPVDRAGCYVPGGRYPLPSSALMTVLTAKAAGVARVAACSPPSADGGIHPAVLAALDIAGADEVYCMGGAQAIAAFAYGAGAVRKVDLIVGPGNRFVTEAKRQVQGDVGIDGLAGPSEVLIIADGGADPRAVAADLAAQAEHDPDARAVLVALDRPFIEAVSAALEALLEALPTGKTARAAWAAHGALLLADTLEDAIAFANDMAPEHIELQVAHDAARRIAGGLRHYGSLFGGYAAPVPIGDFVSGTNHVLPTGGAARFSGGLSVAAFLRPQFFQYLPPEALRVLAPPALTLAAAEGLAAHGESLRARL